MTSIFTRLIEYRPIRYLIAGSVGAFVHIGVVYVLSHLLSVWYGYATTIGFITALAVSFTLQKFFTFRDARTHVLVSQSSFFSLVAVTNLVLNNALMVLLVEYAALLPAIAQFFTSGAVALWAYFAYSRLFKVKERPTMREADSLKENVKE